MKERPEEVPTPFMTQNGWAVDVDGRRYLVDENMEPWSVWEPHDETARWRAARGYWRKVDWWL